MWTFTQSHISLSDCCNIRCNWHLFFCISFKHNGPFSSNCAYFLLINTPLQRSQTWKDKFVTLVIFICTDIKEMQQESECQESPSLEIFCKICKRCTWLWNKTWNIASNFWYTHSQQQGTPVRLTRRTPLLIALGLPEQAVLIMHTHSCIFSALRQAQRN